MNDLRPTRDSPLASHFPTFIGSAHLPKDIPINADDDLSPIFIKLGISASEIYNSVQGGVTNVMKLKPADRTRICFHPKPMYRSLVTTSIPWLMSSKRRTRDHWPWAGAAYLESLVVPIYHPPVIAGYLRHARVDLLSIMLDNVVGSYVEVEGSSGKEVLRKNWGFVDGLQTPANLTPKADILSVDIEEHYRDSMADLELYVGCDAIVKAINRVFSAKVFHVDEKEKKACEHDLSDDEDAEATRRKASLQKGKSYLSYEVATATSKLLEVRCFYV